MKFRHTRIRDLGKSIGLEDRPWWQRLLQKHYYGNTIEYYANVEGEQRIRAAQNESRPDSLLRKQYGRECFSTLPEVRFSGQKFEEIRNRAVSSLDDPALSPCIWNNKQTRERRKDLPLHLLSRDVRRFTKNVAQVLPDASELFSEEFVEAIKVRIGGNFFLENIMLTRNYPVDDQIRSVAELLSERWHFDDQFTDGFSVFICLSDVSKDDGPFTVVNRLDSMKILRRGYSRDKRVSSETGGVAAKEFEDAPSLTTLTGKPGSKLLCHTSFCLHKGGVPLGDRHRDMMIFAFRHSNEMDLRWPRPKDGLS